MKRTLGGYIQTLGGAKTEALFSDHPKPLFRNEWSEETRQIMAFGKRPHFPLRRLIDCQFTTACLLDGMVKVGLERRRKHRGNIMPFV